MRIGDTIYQRRRRRFVSDIMKKLRSRWRQFLSNVYEYSFLRISVSVSRKAFRLLGAGLGNEKTLPRGVIF